jgi:hypothetical protein
MLKGRKQTIPFFKMPVPFDGVKGQYEQLGFIPDLTRVAMMQVIEADTHDNYLVCRGYDPEAETTLLSVPVAKPYSDRGTNTYAIGQMFPAVKPRTEIGENPGKSHTTTGHPADLDEVIDLLLDDDDNPISWLLLTGGSSVAASIPILNVTEAMTVDGETDNALTIPAYALVQLSLLYDEAQTNTESDYHAAVEKPAIPFNSPMYVNSAASVEVDKTGVSYDNASGPVLFQYEWTSETDPPVGLEFGPTHRSWFASMSYPSCVTLLAVVDSEAKLARGQWHDLRGGPRLSGRATSRVTVDTQWFKIDTVQVLDYGGIAYTNQDGTVDVYNPGRDENTYAGYCLEQGMTIEAVWDATLLDGVGAYKIGDSPCGACL